MKTPLQIAPCLHGREAPTLAAKRPHVRLGVWGARKLPQRVRVEPGRQTFLMHLWPENYVWERLSSLNRLHADLGAKHAF